MRLTLSNAPIPGWKRFQQRASLLLISILLAAPCLLLPAGALSQDEEAPPAPTRPERARFELDEVVVTGTRSEDPVRKVPRNITVITEEDIEQAPSNSIVDLLAREANINPRSFFGNDKTAGVDIRGMGDTFVSNVVVLVDGFRLNPPDLSGPDFSSIPMDQIERIEILRGAGSVVYGDGAVGGVINIITKKGKGEPEARIYSSYGSYDSHDTRASYQGRTGRLAFRLNGGYASSEGYRDNGGLRKNDGGIRFGYDITDSLVADVSAAFHRDDYGLPGPVALEDIDSKERRRETTRPFDEGTTQDSRYSGGLEWDLDKWGVLSAHRSYRFRDNRYIMGFSPLLPADDQRNHIDEDSKVFDLDWVKHVDLFGLEHRLHLGFDHFKTEYVATRLAWNQRKNSELESLGGFAMLRLGLLEGLHLDLGYRKHRTDGIFRTDQRVTLSGDRVWVNGEAYEREWSNTAWDVGIVWDITPDHTVFASFASSFRTPNADELGLSDDDLQPQEGTHMEIGSRHLFGDYVELSLTLFQIEIEDEIYYDGTDFGLNRNYDDTTLRRGIETDIKLYLLENLFVWGNWTLMKAEFEERGTRVPLVPDTKASLGFEWQALEPLLVAVTGTWVGARFDGSDEDNQTYPELEEYKVLDGKITYRREGWKLFLGVNNILDEAYAPLAYSGTYYPAPMRNVYGGFEWRF